MNTLTHAPGCAATRPINLALQGGGSLGAFTWGVLDALLQDERIGFEGISGTSSGAMNAVALAHGFVQGAGESPSKQRERARESLASFWNGLVALSAMGQVQRAPFDFLLNVSGGQNSPTGAWAEALTKAWTGSLSPYQVNPLGINPLKDYVERQIDFERLAAQHELQLFVVATRVSTGRPEVFSGARLSANAVMASACLPMMFQAVEIEGEHYWDGGYSGNPALTPLVERCACRDLVLVQVNPQRRQQLPTSALDILDRLGEVSANAALVAELRAIDLVNRQVLAGLLPTTAHQPMRMHCIDGGAVLEQLTGSTKLSTDAKLIEALHDLGQAHARQWLVTHADDVGQRSSIDVARDYLGDLQLPLGQR